MKKYLANILTTARIIIGISLFAFPDFNAVFLILLVICGLTDLLDGPVARAMHSTSMFGAKMDTAGDIITYLALLKILIRRKYIDIKTLLWFLLPVVLMLSSVFISKVRFHVSVFTHTFLGKALGWGCFFLPFSVIWNFLTVLMTIMWYAAFVAGIELILIQLTINHPDPDILFLSLVRKSNLRFNDEK